MITTVKHLTSTWVPGPILGIETSCDETAASVLAADGVVLSNIIASQHAVHQRFGGVVPELASRAHIESIEDVSAEAMQQAGLAWTDLSSIAVTQGPGLAGALLVGVNYAKALAYALNIPVVGVSHLEGHIASAWLQDPAFPLPCVVLVVSGGHTHLYYKDPAVTAGSLALPETMRQGKPLTKALKCLDWNTRGGRPSIAWLSRETQTPLHFPDHISRRGVLISALVV